jgi:hypothetical protein
MGTFHGRRQCPALLVRSRSSIDVLLSPDGVSPQGSRVAPASLHAACVDSEREQAPAADLRLRAGMAPALVPVVGAGPVRPGGWGLPTAVRSGVAAGRATVACGEQPEPAGPCLLTPSLFV